MNNYLEAIMLTACLNYHVAFPFESFQIMNIKSPSVVSVVYDNNLLIWINENVACLGKQHTILGKCIEMILLWKPFFFCRRNTIHIYISLNYNDIEGILLIQTLQQKD